MGNVNVVDRHSEIRTASVLGQASSGTNLCSVSHLITKASIFTRTATPVAKAQQGPRLESLFDGPAADQNLGHRGNNPPGHELTNSLKNRTFTPPHLRPPRTQMRDELLTTLTGGCS
jgi:hypothetical protein